MYEEMILAFSLYLIEKLRFSFYYQLIYEYKQHYYLFSVAYEYKFIQLHTNFTTNSSKVLDLLLNKMLGTWL